MAKTRKKTRKARKAKAKEPDVHAGVFWAWFFAVSEAQRGKPGLLIKVLRTDFGASPEAHKAEQIGRDMLARWLERRLTRKKGGQPKRLFNLRVEDDLARQANIVRRLQAGEISHITDLGEGLAPEQLRRGVDLSKTLLETFKPKRRSRAEAIDKLAVGETQAKAHEDMTKLRKYIDGTASYGRGR